MQSKKIMNILPFDQGIHQGKFGRPGISEKMVGSFLFQDLQESLASG